MTISVRFVIGLCLAGILHATAATATAATVQCDGNSNPRISPIWTAFVNHVRQEYGGGKELSLSDVPYAYGHALGRLASAVHGDDERRGAYECVQLGIDQKLGEVQFRGTMERPDLAATFQNQQRIAAQAARGFHDDDVKVKFGVTAVSPLDSVFLAAIHSTRRTSQAPNPAPQPTRSSGGSRFGQAPSSGAADLLSSTAPTRAGTNTFCESGGRWSLEQATGAFIAATTASGLVTTDCRGSNWNNCRSIEASLNIARDHLFQTADQNFDGVAECKLCNFRNIIQGASQLVTWQNWLHARYYNASGLSNIYYTIQDMDRAPLCKIARPLPPMPVTPPQPPRPSPQIKTSIWVLAQTKIDASGSNSQCRHQPGKITWNRPRKGGAQISYNLPPSTLSPGEKFKISARGNVNITRDHDKYPGFGVIVGGRHIGNGGTVVGMKRSNTPTGLRYSASGERSFSAPSSFNAINEFTVVVSDNWCPKVLFVYRKTGAAAPVARGGAAAPVARGGSTAPVGPTVKFHWEICRYRDKFCRPSNACVATKSEMDEVIRRNGDTNVWRATGRKSGSC